MGLRALCAAAAVVVGVGQAEAATYNVAITLHEAKEEIWSDDLSEIVTVNPYAEYWTIPVGGTKRGQLTIEEVSDTEGHAVLTIGGVSVFDGYGSLSEDSIHASEPHGGSWDMSFLRWQDGSGMLEYVYDGTWITRGALASLTLAPVPLPAPAALLPLGLGAFAMMRKRRRLVS